ncbi:hypothetical protein PFISCL1PPCAC_13915, partial [Pristionchus fissidentatus]
LARVLALLRTHSSGRSLFATFPSLADMDPKARTSGSPLKTCLICGVKTATCHLGVNACRACAVFYRRAKRGKPYACRSNTRRCALNAEGGITCKRCRFDRLVRVLKGTDVEELVDAQAALESSPVGDKTPTPVRDSPTILMNDAADDRLLQAPSTSTSCDFCSSLRPKRPLLDKCKQLYKVMSSTRRTCELGARPNGPHPLQMNEEECPIYPATFGAMNSFTRGRLAAILEFAAGIFTEFAELSKDEKWQLATSFSYRLEAFEGSYRAEKLLPDDREKFLGSYTCYFSHEMADDFFSDCPYDHEKQNVEQANKILHDYIDLTLPARQVIRRAAPDNEEFHAVLLSLFWFIEGMGMREEIVRVADGYRAAVLQELQSYYREELGLTDYATRVGNFFMLILHFERSEMLKENFEMYRLLGVFTDDTFVYQMQKT